MMRPPAFPWITLAALLASSPALMLAPSETAAADEGIAAQALAPGSWSVQFSVQPNFTLGSYAGSTLSLKRHLGSGNALRFGVSVRFGGGSDDLADVAADTFSTRIRSSAADGNLVSIGVGAYYLWYARGEAPLHVYGGIGPSLSWSRGHDERSQSQILSSSGQPPSTTTSADDITTRAWGIGVAAALGIEWLVARRVGVFAEYGSSLGYSATKSTRRSALTSDASPFTMSTEQDSRRWDFSGSGGRLGVSGYY